MKEFAEKLPTRLTFHLGWELDNLNLENLVLHWIMEPTRAELTVSTLDIIGKDASVDPEFNKEDEKKHIHWVYKFMALENLAVGTRTCASQDIPAPFLPVKKDYCRGIMISYRQRFNNPKLLINMDETVIYFICSR